MPLVIENRGRRAANIQLDPSIMKRRQRVLTTKRDSQTGNRSVVARDKVLGESLTVLAQSKVSVLPNGQPIPDRVAKLEQVRSNRDLHVSSISVEAWAERHKKSARKRAKAKAPKAKPAPKAEAADVAPKAKAPKE